MARQLFGCTLKPPLGYKDYWMDIGLRADIERRNGQNGGLYQCIMAAHPSVKAREENYNRYVGIVERRQRELVAAFGVGQC